jgi:hypothetical protein
MSADYPLATWVCDAAQGLLGSGGMHGQGTHPRVQTTAQEPPGVRLPVWHCIPLGNVQLVVGGAAATTRSPQ